MTLFIDCASCRGEKVWHYVSWDGEIVTEFCNDCYGSGKQEFTCHDGCPPYDHLHDEVGDIVLPDEMVPVDYYQPEWLVGS